VLLPLTHSQAALALAERTRAAIAQAKWDLRTVTASFGVATVNDATHTWDLLVKLADKALYRSKETGRNRVTNANELAQKS
jgi:diguanylate cyclase (GGDEF)-like protein